MNGERSEVFQAYFQGNRDDLEGQETFAMPCYAILGIDYGLQLEASRTLQAGFLQLIIHGNHKHSFAWGTQGCARLQRM